MALHTFSILPGFPELRGLRTRLRAPRAGDGERLRELVHDPDGWLEECAGFLAGGDRIDWVVTTRHDDDAIGTCTLHGIDRHARCAKIGYALRTDCRGRGYASDAAARAIAWAGQALGITRIDADVDENNEASQRLLRGLGFTALEGTRWSRQLPRD
jgi:RimJ/RimL family protein N-acetyltransferase